MIAASTKKWNGAADAAAADRLSIWLSTTSLLFVFVQLAKYLCYKGPDDLLECPFILVSLNQKALRSNLLK